jgi:predicted ATPase/class 3 adenylate cyclase/tetratricopeptide (TPR) repeat protein
MSDIKALLLTDVVNSTQLSEALGDAAMAELWAAHDRVARTLLPAWRGREIDKTDGMLLMFDTATDAVGYALAYHRSLAEVHESLQARAGLHVGPVLLRENSPDDIARGAKPLEVDGLAKPTAARVMSLARGGQTLMTSESRWALGASALRTESHGHWMLRGISTPVELFEIGDTSAPFQPPADSEKVYRVVRSGERWVPAVKIPNNLPQQATSFIGRDRELDEIKGMLGEARLLTLLGMGGLGKTRLSLQVAAESMAEYPDGVWFLDLASIHDPALVVSEAAQALSVREEADQPLVKTLCAFLATRKLLLVFDNCEHLIKASAELAHAALRAAPKVQILATSRQALHVPGEQAYPILPLPVPKHGDDLESLGRSTAVRLFVERARLHKPAFSLGAREAPAVAELVARLEGIPLALELAAARVRSLTVADINARLKDRYKFLTGGSGVLQERQQTLRALVDWSHELLTESEQVVLRRLAAFSGGFDLAAAERVGGAEPIDDFDVLDILSSLIEKSLVMLDERDESARYRMLDTIRDYAGEKLAASGEAAETASRHCDHYFAMAKAANVGLASAQQADWIWRVETELDNMRSAMALALAGGVDAFIAVKFAVAMQGFWILRGYSTEGRTYMKAALALPAIQASDIAQAWGLYVGAALAESQSDHVEARRMLESCLELRRGLGHPVDVAATLSTLSMARLQGGDATGAAAAEREALALFRGLDDRIGEAIGLLHLGQIATYLGEDEAARADLESGLAIARDIEHQEIEAECELVLGEILLEGGSAEAACARFKRSLTICREAGDKRGEANALWWLGQADMRSGDLKAARGRLAEALRAFRAFEMREELLGCLEDLAALASAEHRPTDAARLAAATARLREALALAIAPRRQRRWQLQVETIRADLPPAEFETASQEGRAWSVDRAIQGALAPQPEAVTA